MAKPLKRFVCQSCGAVTSKWGGRCESCGEWNTIVEENNAGGIGSGDLFDQGIGQALATRHRLSGFDLLRDLRDCSRHQTQLLAATVRFILDHHSHADAGPILGRTRNVF